MLRPTACNDQENIMQAPTEESSKTEITDQSSFDEICNAYSERILNLAFRMTGDVEAARDLTQDIFLKVYEKLDTFEERSQIYTWIYRIAVNHVLNYLKKERRYKWMRILDKPVLEAFREGSIESDFQEMLRSPGADQQMERDELGAVVRKMIHSLADKYRLPLILFRYEELSYKEIADVMNLSLSAVETRIHRANKQLIAKLEPWIDKI